MLGLAYAGGEGPALAEELQLISKAGARGQLNGSLGHSPSLSPLQQKH